MIDDLEDESAKGSLHAAIDSLEDALLPAALMCFRELRRLVEQIGEPETLNGLAAALLGLLIGLASAAAQLT
jgi:hypothetical protein